MLRKYFSLRSQRVKGSPITKAITCTNKTGNFVKETDTSGYIVV